MARNASDLGSPIVSREIIGMAALNKKLPQLVDALWIELKLSHKVFIQINRRQAKHLMTIPLAWDFFKHDYFLATVSTYSLVNSRSSMEPPSNNDIGDLPPSSTCDSRNH